jgi:toxin HigB-1
MKVIFARSDLERLESDPEFEGSSPALTRAFRKVMNVIRSAPDERTFYGLKSLHFEKLQGKRSHQHSMRLNDKYRLVVELERDDSGKLVKIVSIEDYH